MMILVRMSSARVIDSRGSVQSVLLDVAQRNLEVCKTPAPRVRFRAFGDSSLAYELLCWVEKPVLRGRVSHALNAEVYKQFLKEGIDRSIEIVRIQHAVEGYQHFYPCLGENRGATHLPMFLTDRMDIVIMIYKCQHHT